MTERCDRTLLDELVEAALAHEPLTREQAQQVLDWPDQDTVALVGAVARVRFRYFGRRVKLNFLLNVKSGLCPEDCHYCSQARDATAPIPTYTLLDDATFCAAAARARELGATRLCLVASGRGPTPTELSRFAERVRAVKQQDPALEICACLGLLQEGQAEQLHEAGVFAYNHNLNTSERYYASICATHEFGDRVETVQRAQAGGLSPCSGALFGMGETDADILDVAFALRALEPDSVPINFLIPIPGTPLAARRELTPQRCLRILALYRLLFPRAEVRIAGGREVHLRSLQALGLYLANSIFIGDYLTTKGQATQADLELIADAGLVVEGSEDAPAPYRTAPVELKRGALES